MIKNCLIPGIYIYKIVLLVLYLVDPVLRVARVVFRVIFIEKCIKMMFFFLIFLKLFFTSAPDLKTLN